MRICFSFVNQNLFPMLKNLIIASLALFIIASCSMPVKNKFNITGTVDTVFDAMVYLQKRVETPLVSIDSTQLSNGKFSFSGNIDYPEVYYINIPATKSLIPFFVEASDITIHIIMEEIDKSIIEGSGNQDLYDSYLDVMSQFNAGIRENYHLYLEAQESGDQEKAVFYDSLMNDYDQQKIAYSKDFVLKNNKSFVSPYIVYRNSWNYEMEELEEALNNFDVILANSRYTGFLNDFLNTMKLTSVGMPFIAFTMEDTSGISVPIADLIGENYLLVDFWASWCGPCREENPNLVAAYQKYNDKGFDILGVSLDRQRDQWIKAIINDNLTWNHVSDLKGWDNSSAKLYGVRSIPANLLLDPSGYIIAKNLRGEELLTKLEEIFSQNL